MTDLSALLDQLGVAPEDARELMASRPTSPALRGLIEQTADAIAATVGRRDAPRMVSLPSSPIADADPFFSAHVCLALLPHVRRYHHDRGIPDRISWQSLRALGDNLARHRRIYGTGGLDGPGWVVLVFRGLVYRLGRLVFERSYIDPALAGSFEGQDALGVHIPPAGPLLPAECDRAFVRAVEFFARHFPEDRLGYAHCHSWLLDPQLAEYLPADSNLVRFARRFRLVPEHADEDTSGDQAIVRWIFETAHPADLTVLTPQTTLERAILRHLGAGRHWKARSGWLELPG
jgi:hypothetical protein